MDSKPGNKQAALLALAALALILTLTLVLMLTPALELVAAPGLSQAASPRQASAETVYPAEDLIRLHVVANSDSPADQDLKNKVRDEIIGQVAQEFLAAGNLESARLTAGANLGRIGAIAARTVAAAGKDYQVRVELRSLSFPTKHYGPFLLPAGDYEAVLVVIGSGGGSNWWCVLFPPLCFVDLSKDAGPRVDAGGRLDAGGRVEIKSELPGSAGAPLLAKEASVKGTENVVKVEYRFRFLDFWHGVRP